MVPSILSLRTLFYLAYGVVLTAVLIYVRFPAEKVGSYCEKSIERVLRDSDCSIGKMKFVFPDAVSLEDVRLSRTVEGNTRVFVIDSLTISPRTQFFWKEFMLTGGLYGGVFTSHFDLAPATRGIALTDIRLNNLDAAEVLLNLGISARKVTGRVDFKGSYQASIDNLSEGEGEGLFTAHEGSIQLLEPVLSLSAIDFQELGFELKYAKRNFSIQSGELKGKDVAADFSGTFGGGDSFLSNVLFLSGQLSPRAAFLSAHPGEQKMVQVLLKRYKSNELPFKIGGTLNRPTLRFSR